MLLLHGFQGESLKAEVQRNAASETIDYGSLKSIRKQIKKLLEQHEEKERRERKEGKKKPAGQFEEEVEGLDYLGALEYRLGLRAFPEDRVDWEAVNQAAVDRDRMPGSGFRGKSASNWEFLGPKNCFPPYVWGFGPGQFIGRAASAAMDPNNPNTFYVATSGGGVWKTVNGGANWVPLGDDFTTMNMSCVVVDPSNSNNVYAGTGDYDGFGGYSYGILKSQDGGQTWTNVGRPQFGNNAIRRIIVDPENGQIVTAVAGRGASGTGRVWRSTDGGNTWASVINVNASWSDIVYSAKDGSNNRAYYACSGGTAASVWISTDRGATWTQLTTPMRSGTSSNDTADLATSPTTPGTVYLFGTGNRKVWKSTNYGGSWTDITGAALTSASWSQAWYDFYISCSTNGINDVLYVGLVDLLQSPDGGTTWRTFLNAYNGTTDKAHVDQHDFVVDPNNPSRGLSCNDGGVYLVDFNSGLNTWTFTSLNSTLGHTEFYKADWHPTDGQRMIGGTQDNGTPASLGNIANWRSVTGGDGGAALINQSNPDIQYSTYQYLGASSSGGTIQINRTRNNWNSSTTLQQNVGTDRIAWMGPVAMDPNNSGILYIGTNYLWRLNDSGASPVWTARLGNQVLASSGTVNTIAVAKQNSNVIYTGATNGQLFVTRNGGTSWTQINTGSPSLPARAITSIKPLDSNGNDIIVTVSGTGTGHVWRCADTSATTRVWIDVSGSGLTGLPNIPANDLERDPSDPANIWYVGTDIGVFQTTNGGSTWDNITRPRGLPNVEISVLKIRNGYLYAATFGRGMWRLNVSPSSVDLAGLSLNPTVVIGPNPSQGTVTLTLPAGAGGTTVNLASNNPAVASVPASVTVAQGQTTATFTVTTTAVSSQTVVRITATLGTVSQFADLTVNANGLTDLQFNPIQVIGGNNSQGTVTVGSPAPVGGTQVTLTSLNTAAATVPGSVTIPAGQTTANFTITTLPVANDTNVSIRATSGSSQLQNQLTVTAPSLTGISITPSEAFGGTTATGTISLDGRAAAGGVVVNLSSSDTAAATVPATVTVPANATSVNFTVTAKVVAVDTGVVITGSLRGIQRFANFVVKAQQLLGVTATPNPVVGGNAVTGRVTLGSPAPSATIVNLGTSDATTASVPASVTVQQGQTGANFAITTSQVNVDKTVSVFAYYGTQQKSTELIVRPLLLQGFSVTPSTAFELQTLTGTVTLNGPAPVGGAVVTIQNSNPAIGPVPTSVTVAQGQTTKSFTFIAASTTSPRFATITAFRGNINISTNISVSPVTMDSLALSANSVTGGINTQGVVRLVAPAPANMTITLASSNTNAATVPASITISKGALSKTFTITTKPVTGTSFVAITASRGPQVITQQLQVLPAEVATFRLSTTQTKGGNSISGTVTLTGKAPAGGATVTINSIPGLVFPTASVVVPAGATSKTFSLRTSAVSSATQVNVTARTYNIVKSALITLTP